MFFQKGFDLDMFVGNKLKPHSSTSPIKASLTRFQNWCGFMWLQNESVVINLILYFQYFGKNKYYYQLRLCG